MYRSSGGDHYSSGGRGSSSGSRDRYERDRVPSRYRSPSPSYDRYRSSGGGGGGSSSSRYERSPPRRRSPSPPRYRSSGGSSRYRSPSPGPSYGRHGGSSSSGRDSRRRESPDRHDKRRDRSADDRKGPTAEDNRNVLERMEKSFTDGPLDALKRSIKERIKVKVWTRNYKEVRGICTGYVLAFDKHWNIVMRDVDEVYLKPRKSKTPFLRDLKPGDSELIPEMQPKVPKEKKPASEKPEDTAMETEKSKEVQSESGIESGADPAKEGGDAGKPKKKRRKKRKTPLMCKRHIKKVFIRGDNVVMVALTSEDPDSRPEQSGEEDA